MGANVESDGKASRYLYGSPVLAVFRAWQKALALRTVRITLEEWDGVIGRVNLEDYQMSDDGIQMGMTPPHPGTFIRIEALEEFG